jgi:superfamily I DNA and/or RNA helicase
LVSKEVRDDIASQFLERFQSRQLNVRLWLSSLLSSNLRALILSANDRNLKINPHKSLLARIFLAMAEKLGSCERKSKAISDILLCHPLRSFTELLIDHPGLAGQVERWLGWWIGSDVQAFKAT